MKCIKTNVFHVCLLFVISLFSCKAKKTRKQYSFIKGKIKAMQKNNVCCSGGVVPFELRKFFTNYYF